MNLRDFFDAAPQLLHGLVQNKKALILACIVFLLVVFCIGLLQCGSKPEKKPILSGSPPVAPLERDSLILPNEPSPEQGYVPFRETTSAWSDAEMRRWFTEPDGSSFEQLHRENNRMVEDVLGAVP